MDLISISTAFTSVKTLLEITKTLQDQKVISAINSAVADIQVKLIEAQQQILSVQDENSRLRGELTLLRKQAELEETVSFHDGAYWKKVLGDKEEGPFCPSCWDLNRKLVYPSVAEFYATSASLFCSHHGKDSRYFSVPRHLAEHLQAL